ncbi:MAG: hypothetical protein HFI50_17450 [Lachnospiraceae bacterium]|nr:hypothetical protein [Lachnospiraceae bacterium]
MEAEYDLQLSDLPYPMKDYAAAIGINGIIKLSEAAGGQNIYIPNKENLLNYATARHIKEDRKKGISISEISKKYQISRGTVYNKLKE